jgi:hypothetical protein
MIKSKSYSSNLTAVTNSLSINQNIQNLKLNYTTSFNNLTNNMVTSLGSPKTSKFSKKLVHKPT